MKQQYLEQLRVQLQCYDMTSDELKDIINDYEQMYNDGLSRGLSDEEVYAFLGKPEKVVDDLKDNYAYIETNIRSHNGKIIAVMPFVSVLLYFFLGMFYDFWHPGWLVFLLIPVSAIILNKNKNLISTLTALSPFIATTVFIIIGYFTHIYNPTWSIFLLIPLIGALNSENRFQGIGFAISLLIASILYMYLGYTLGDWLLAATAFFIPIAFGLFTGSIKIHLFHQRQSLPITITFFVTVIIYFGFGFLYSTWAYLWMIFLLIPMIAIFLNVHDKNKIVALMPFMSTIIFFTLGYFFGLWAFSWIAFLLIPVVAIIRNA